MQKTKIIDVSKGFALIDPSAFPENLRYTTQEDSPEEPLPVLGFEGYNFMPTSYGYRSYFGANSKLDIDPMESRVSELLMYQFANYRNIVVALTENGIRISRASTVGANWKTKDGVDAPDVIVSPTAAEGWPSTDWLGGKGFFEVDVPLAGSTEPWSHAVIENVLYMYRAGESFVYTISPNGISGDVVTVGSFTPSFLNMTGQRGIFRANGRLGFWDSANSVSWSSAFVKSDFLPSVETLAGNAIFNGIVGRIVKILPQGDGYVIYATKSIVGVRYATSGATLWDANTITDIGGIAYEKQVSLGATELEHYAFTSVGIKKIGSFNALNKAHSYEDIITDVYDLLKESRDPVYLQMLNGRYLILTLMNEDYINGAVNHLYENVDPITIHILVNGFEWDELEIHTTTITMDAGEEWIDGDGEWIYSDYENERPLDEPALTPVAFPDLVREQVEKGISGGMYSQWTAQGECMVPSKVPSAINPYNQDSGHNHIPNEAPDLTSLLTEAEVQELVKAGTLSSYDSELYPAVFGTELGWTAHITQSTSELGRPDRYINEFIRTQMREWNNYPIIQVATYDKLMAATEELLAIVLGAVEKSALTGVTIASLRAAYISWQQGLHTGATAAAQYITQDTQYGYYNTDITWTEEIGQLFRGSGTIAPPVITLPGSYHSEIDITKTFTQGVRIYRDTVRKYRVRMPIQSARPQYAVALAAVDSRVTLWPASVTAASECPAAGITSAKQTDLSYNSGVFPYLQAFLGATGGALPDVIVRTYLGVAGWTFTKDSALAVSTGAPDGFGWTYTGAKLGQEPVIGAILYEILFVYTEPLYEDYQDTFTLRAVADANLTKTSTIHATQKSLDWGMMMPEDPVDGPTPPPFPWVDAPDTDAYRNKYWSPDGNSYPLGAFTITTPGNRIMGGSVMDRYIDITYPGATFLLQDGSAAPLYPTFQGALVLDTAYKKWGKMKVPYKVLMDLSPINAPVDGIISYSNFGVDMAMLNEIGEIYAFDAKPTDSRIRYGKIGYSRGGVTELYEVRAHFRFPFSGVINVESSLDGRFLMNSPITAQWFINAGAATLYSNQIGRWHTVTISGNFDLNYLEVRGNIAGRR